jgi:hypothetical protein
MQGILGHHRTGFAEAVAFDERDMEPRLKLPEHLHRQRGRAADAQPERQLPLDRRVGERAIELWDGRQNGCPVLGQFPEQRARLVQRLHQHHRAAAGQWQEHPHRQHVGVKERQDHPEAVFRRVAQHLLTTPDVVQQIAVREHRALRVAGCTGGVNQDRQIGGLPLRRGRRAGRRRPRARARDIHHAQAGPRRGQCRQRLGLAGVRQEHVRTSVSQNVVNLGRLEEVVHWHRHCVAQQDAQN